MVSFKERVKGILREKKITIGQFCFDTGIDRAGFFYKHRNSHHRAYYMAIAYYLNMSVEDLVAGTDVEDFWYS